MKVRRRTTTGFSLEKLLGWLNPVNWFQRLFANDRHRRAFQRRRQGEGGTGSQFFGPASKTGSPTAESPRMTAPNPMRLRQIPARMRNLRPADLNWKWLFGGTFVGSVATGYLVAAVFFFPAPFFSSERPVPRVIGLSYDDALVVVVEAGLEVGESRYENHPSYTRDQIAWQDPPEGVRVPEGTLVSLVRSRGPQEIPVPDVSRYNAEIASMLITRSGLTIQRTDSIQTALPNGVAVTTRPPAGATRLPGQGVVLIVSRGAPTMSVPDLAGLTLEEAQEELELLGLTIGRSWQEFSNAQPEGLIFRQVPPAGTLIAPGTPISVVIARTP